MRILVTGATGFVGGNVARVFSVLGDQVLCAVRRRPPDGFGHPWRLTDLMDADDLRRALAEHQAQAVVHLAIRNDLLDLYQDRRGAYADYVTITRRIVDAANGAGAAVLYVSTDWVFDGTGHMVCGTCPRRPRSWVRSRSPGTPAWAPSAPARSWTSSRRACWTRCAGWPSSGGSPTCGSRLPRHDLATPRLP